MTIRGLQHSLGGSDDAAGASAVDHEHGSPADLLGCFSKGAGGGVIRATGAITYEKLDTFIRVISCGDRMTSAE